MKSSLLFIVLFITIGYVFTSKILLVPIPFAGQNSSPVVIMKSLGSELVKRGHEVYLLLKEEDQTLKHVEGIRILTFKGEKPKNPMEFQKNMVGKGMYNPLTWLLTIGKVAYREMSFMLQDDELYRLLEDISLDIAIVDGLVFFPWLPMVSYKLGVPYILMTPKYEPWYTGTPTLPSHVPHFMSPGFTEDMSLSQRIYNLCLNVAEIVTSSYVVGVSWDVSLSKKFVPERPPVTAKDLMSNSKLWLIIEEPLIDYPKPYMPHVIPIGGITAQPPNNLPPDIENAVSSAQDGVILVAFGSVVKYMPQDWLIKIVAALSDVSLKNMNILWKYTGSLSDKMPSNIKLFHWLPQNDILGHQKTRLFVSHCGNNGQQEAAYHGIPTLCLPFGNDMMYNANRLAYRKLGRFLDIRTATSTEIVSVMKDLLIYPNVTDNAKRVSGIIKHKKMSSREKAAFWIEFVIEHGSDHLRSIAITMPWWKYYMVDIFVITILISVFSYNLLKWCICGAFKQLYKGEGKKKLS